MCKCVDSRDRVAGDTFSPPDSVASPSLTALSAVPVFSAPTSDDGLG